MRARTLMGSEPARGPSCCGPNHGYRAEQTGDTHYDQGPVPQSQPGADEGCGNAHGHAGQLNPGDSRKTHLSFQNRVVLQGQAGQGEGRGRPESYRRNPWILVKPGNQRGAQRQHNPQAGGYQDVDPEQIAHLLMGNLILLHGGHGQTHIAEQGDKMGHNRNHSHQTIIRRRQHPRKHHGRNQPDRIAADLADQGPEAAADGFVLQIGFDVFGVEEVFILDIGINFLCFSFDKKSPAFNLLSRIA